MKVGSIYDCGHLRDFKVPKYERKGREDHYSPGEPNM